MASCCGLVSGFVFDGIVGDGMGSSVVGAAGGSGSGGGAGGSDMAGICDGCACSALGGSGGFCRRSAAGVAAIAGKAGGSGLDLKRLIKPPVIATSNSAVAKPTSHCRLLDGTLACAGIGGTDEVSGGNPVCVSVSCASAIGAHALASASAKATQVG